MYKNEWQPCPTFSWPDFGDVDVGWVAGGGLEYAFSESVSFRGEALYMDFGDVTSRNQDGFRMKVDRSVLAVTAGVNFKF
jgi:opacity protein-like surface antigen